MKILYVIHYYLPRHQAGTELYTQALARKFKEEGHRVWIFTSEDQAQPGWELKKDEYEGIEVFRIYHSGARDFRSTYQREEFDRIFARVLEQIQPEVVHFQHLLRLSLGFIAEAKKRNMPSLMTLADYWLICPAIIMLKPEDQPCASPEQGRACVRCAHSLSGMIPNLLWQMPGVFQRASERALAYAHQIKRQLPPGWVEWLREVLGKKAEQEKKSRLLSQRWEEMKKAVSQLDLIISPSRFLQEMMISSGMVPEEKIIYSDYGFESRGFLPRDRFKSPGEPLILGFIGTLVRHKGVHILIQALKYLEGENLELRIYGSLEEFPGYVRWLKKLADKDKRIKWMGRAEHSQVPEVLKEIDLLVVPSLWYENSPLTIHEGFLARLPVLASNLGGMKELVREGRGGMLFEANNPKNLAEKIRMFIKNPELIPCLKCGTPPVKTIEQNYKELLQLYEKIKKAGN